jgi:hypothetical protein
LKNVESDLDKFIEIVVAFVMLIIAGVTFWILTHVFECGLIDGRSKDIALA